MATHPPPLMTASTFMAMERPVRFAYTACASPFGLPGQLSALCQNTSVGTLMLLRPGLKFITDAPGVFVGWVTEDVSTIPLRAESDWPARAATLATETVPLLV